MDRRKGETKMYEVVELDVEEIEIFDVALVS
jgi:hypothetical protein